MSKNLEMPDSVYAALVRAANASGTSAVEWIAAKLPSTPEHIPPAESPSDSSSLDDFDAELDALLVGSENFPVLPAEAYSRQSIYGDHD